MAREYRHGCLCILNPELVSLNIYICDKRIGIKIYSGRSLDMLGSLGPLGIRTHDDCPRPKLENVSGEHRRVAQGPPEHRAPFRIEVRQKHGGERRSAVPSC